MNHEEDILDYVRQHPGCNHQDLITATGHPNAGNEADHMAWGGTLDRWYTGQVPAYYIPGTYMPPHLREPETEETMKNEARQLQYEKRDSIEVTRNAKGEYGWKIKQYYNSPDQQVDDIVGDLIETDKQLREAFL